MYNANKISKNLKHMFAYILPAVCFISGCLQLLNGD